MQFSAKVETTGAQTVISMSGPIDENTEFPQVEGAPSKVVLDLNGVKYINSIGIKMWIQWIAPVAAKSSIEFRNCPKAIIMQMNMVRNFLPPGSVVSSFYLPLFCEACDREEAVLLETEKDLEYDGDNVKIAANLPFCIKCEKESCEVEVDVIEKKYFRFLKESK